MGASTNLASIQKSGEKEISEDHLGGKEGLPQMGEGGTGSITYTASWKGEGEGDL